MTQELIKKIAETLQYYLPEDTEIIQEYRAQIEKLREEGVDLGVPSDGVLWVTPGYKLIREDLKLQEQFKDRATGTQWCEPRTVNEEGECPAITMYWAQKYLSLARTIETSDVGTVDVEVECLVAMQELVKVPGWEQAIAEALQSIIFGRECNELLESVVGNISVRLL